MNTGIRNLPNKLKLFFVRTDLMIFGRFVASLGTVQPVYTGVRRIMSDPKSLRLIGAEFARLAKRLKVDIIAGCETAGIPLSTTTSVLSGIPVVYVKKTAKDHGTREAIEGKYYKGQSVLLIDDAVGDGRSKIDFVKNLLRAGLKVKAVVVVLDTSVPLVPELRRLRIPVYSLISYRNLMVAYKKAKKITPALFNLVYNFFDERERWVGVTSRPLWRDLRREVQKSGLPFEVHA